MPKCCVVYISDQTYLFPTLISAIQARRHVCRNLADVMICHLNVDATAERDFSRICREEDIQFLAISPDCVEGANAMMARLFLNRFMPSEYTQYLYIDGDAHIMSSLDRLVEADVPAGHFLAANDPMTFMLPDHGTHSRELASHLQSIGLDHRQATSYFNTGVLRINRLGWAEIGARAWEICRVHQHRFRFPDQDPLNIVSGNSRLPMSLAWNFPIFMRNIRVEKDINPSIYHFMSNPKPWHGTFPPWQAESHTPYSTAVERYPTLANYQTQFPLYKHLRYHLQQRYKKFDEHLNWRFSQRRLRVLDYEEKVRHVMFV